MPPNSQKFVKPALRDHSKPSSWFTPTRKEAAWAKKKALLRGAKR